MYDEYPIFKINAFKLEIGTSVTHELYVKDDEAGSDERKLSRDELEEKEVIEFDDRELEKIEQEKSEEKLKIDQTGKRKEL
jgi:hypothetical protein